MPDNLEQRAAAFLALAEKATEGPWTFCRRGDRDVTGIWIESPSLEAFSDKPIVAQLGLEKGDKHDATFIVAARNTAPAGT